MGNAIRRVSLPISKLAKYVPKPKNSVETDINQRLYGFRQNVEKQAAASGAESDVSEDLRAFMESAGPATKTYVDPATAVENINRKTRAFRGSSSDDKDAKPPTADELKNLYKDVDSIVADMKGPESAAPPPADKKPSKQELLLSFRNDDTSTLRFTEEEVSKILKGVGGLEEANIVGGDDGAEKEAILVEDEAIRNTEQLFRRYLRVPIVEEVDGEKIGR